MLERERQKTDTFPTNDRGRLSTYIKPEKGTLLVLSLSGILYNAGMTAGPWFEGKLAQRLCNIIQGRETYGSMVWLSLFYVLTIALVQLLRFIKRWYVRKFANHLNRDMKMTLYDSLVHKRSAELEQEGIGALMTKAISDIDTCVEGIRKFVTEIFDTGVVMISYLVMLFCYDWRLTLLSMLFPPAAYVIADRLKKVVTRSTYAYKESAGKLNEMTYDRIGNGLTYRIYGRESGQDGVYEQALAEYEKKAIRANIWENSMQPVYQIISMMGAVCILWFGAKNVLGGGWTAWDIGAFVTFLSCFTKLAVKSSKAAKLFNAVQKAQVSWKRIRPLLLENQKREGKEENCAGKRSKDPEQIVSVRDLSFTYPGASALFSHLTFSAEPGEIIGVTGPVACGKSTLGALFLGERSYAGEIEIMGGIAYMGHEPELICGTIEENVLLGDEGDAWEALSWVSMEEEIRNMPEGIKTRIGNGGVTLSGGQQARIALARTLFHRKRLIVLDDPFSAVDLQTERQIFERLRILTKDSAVLLISHRLSLFPETDQVIWLNDGEACVSSHSALLREMPEYARLYEAQRGGGDRR